MGPKKVRLLASASALLLVQPAWAQTADQGASNESRAVDNDLAQKNSTMVEEVVVTARRQGENLQDVPQTVTAISASAIENLNIRRADDVVALVPGLTLAGGSDGGTQQRASIRGITLDAQSGADPTLDLYINETPIDVATFLTALYDVGQIEVLRGPQGTLRGRTAPSGAITFSTRRADLHEIGGYVSMTGTTEDSFNAQGALNLPIVRDHLAIRLAGVLDQDNANFVRSFLDGPDPERRTQSGRISIAAQPSDSLSINLAYQRLDDDRRGYLSVEGDGALGGPGLPPAGYNGPPVRARDRLSGQQEPTIGKRVADLVTGQIDFDVLNHRVSYVGGFQDIQYDNHQNLDIGNIIAGGDTFQELRVDSEQTTHELRIASDSPGAFLDYVFGYYHSDVKSNAVVSQAASFLPGAFGSPLVSPVVPGTFDPRYQIQVLPNNAGETTEDSFFVTLVAHLGSRTELSVGGRYIMSSVDRQVLTFLSSGTIATALPIPCAAAGFGSTYAGTCDVPIPARTTPVQNVSESQDNEPFVYTGSIRHSLTDSVNMYATVGSSWRRGPATQGISNAGNDPSLTRLQFLRPEKSVSYEIGAKTTWLDDRLRINTAVFRQDFDNHILRLQDTPYVANNGANVQVSTFPFNTNADARVTGFDIDVSFNPIENWSIGTTVAYADGELTDALVPCRDSNFDGVPDAGTPTLADFQAAGTLVAFCKSNESTSRDPLWSASAQSEFSYPLGPVGAYIRGLVSYRPENSRQDLGFTVDSYALVNLYTGIRSADGAWDIGLFAKNALNDGTQLSRAFQAVEPIGGSTAFFGQPGYYQTSYTLPREFGLTVRYAFGSR